MLRTIAAERFVTLHVSKNDDVIPVVWNVFAAREQAPTFSTTIQFAIDPELVAGDRFDVRIERVRRSE